MKHKTIDISYIHKLYLLLIMVLILQYKSFCIWRQLLLLTISIISPSYIIKRYSYGNNVRVNLLSISITTSQIHMAYFAYACKTEGKNGISCLISALCVNCLNSILEYSRIIDYSIIWMCIWCGLLQKLYKIKKSELLNSKVYSKV